jgi:mycothiol system anti-sigma-R factor
MGEATYNCQESLREIERFLDGEMETDVRSLLERHLQDCPPCMRHVEFSRHLKVMIGSKCAGEPVPDELLVRIRVMIREHEPPSP